MPNPFSIIPQKVLKDKRLKDIELRVLCILSTYVDSDLVCYPSYQTIADSAGCCRRTVIRTIDNLVSYGYVRTLRTSRQDGGFGSNVYYINYNPEPDAVAGSPPSDTTVTTPSDTTVTTPSDTRVTNLVTPVSPAYELYPVELDINPNGFEKSAHRRARIREWEKARQEEWRQEHTLTDEDREAFAELERCLSEQMGTDKAHRGLDYVEIKKTGRKAYAFICTSDFIIKELDKIGFFEALEVIKSDFPQLEIKIIRKRQTIGLDVKQALKEEAA